MPKRNVLNSVGVLFSLSPLKMFHSQPAIRFGTGDDLQYIGQTQAPLELFSQAEREQSQSQILSLPEAKIVTHSDLGRNGRIHTQRRLFLMAGLHYNCLDIHKQMAVIGARALRRRGRN